MAAVAWAVAVEKYAAPEFNSRTPIAMRALEFAEIMLDRGVPVVISVSFNNNYQAAQEKLAALQARGAVVTGAEHGDILNALAQIRGAGTLFVYWIGHGIMAPSRQLLCADSAQNDWRVVDTDSILRRLRANEYPRVQLGFFDCCAQQVAAAPAVLNVGGAGTTQTRQFFFHAASAGQVATADPTRPGFSSAVMAALRAAATPPADPAAFCQGLQSDLAALPLQTRPFLLQWTDESGDQWSRSGRSGFDELADEARVAGLTLSEFGRLWREARKADAAAEDLARALRDGTLPALVARLRQDSPHSLGPDLLEKAAEQLKLEREFEPYCLRLHLSWQDWLSLYDRLAASEPIATPQCEDVQGLLLAALDQARSDRAQRCLTILLELAARRARRHRPLAAQQLADALAAHPLLGPGYPAIAAELPVEDNRRYLLVELDWEPNAKTASLLNAWLYPGAAGRFESREAPASGALAARINAIVQGVLEEFPECPLVVELLAPNELLSTPRELFELTDPELGASLWLEAEHAVTVRWRDRMKGRHNRGTWMQRSAAACPTARGAASLSSVWRPPRAGEAAAGNVIGLCFPGPAPADPNRNRGRFFQELLAGMPYMCWPREQPADPDSFRDAAVKLLNASSLRKLPDALRDGRCCDDAIANLVVLIDEPERNPYMDIDHWTETGQRTET